MKISTKTRYGMRFMIDVAEHWGSGCISMKDVADRQGISKKYLEQVVAPLAQAGLLNVTRGNRGGFQLSRPPEEITLADIVNASEDGIELLDCLGCLSACEREDNCISHNVWGGMQHAIINYLESRTLADVIKESAGTANT
ncbi:Rrf2 family transcriptional regulator [Adlercreutzia sp. ZJ304]|uniref:RrF2 family transcriptional regulator n=1 Tax=Adlercreutzia sp. ZJ304 TaxID=2709791 RepID=UPI0013EC5C23|nr:Rrf2 family transcriptional regulator [Adlercreutzia sp. ZJ304]